MIQLQQLLILRGSCPSLHFSWSLPQEWPREEAERATATLALWGRRGNVESNE